MFLIVPFSTGIPSVKLTSTFCVDIRVVEIGIAIPVEVLNSIPEIGGEVIEVSFGEILITALVIIVGSVSVVPQS